jgi:hypothetical protein
MGTLRQSRMTGSHDRDGTRFKMVSGRTAVMLTAAAAVVLVLPILSAGCGSGTVEIDQAANYSPESLAQELILRYRALKPDARTASLRTIKKSSAPAVSKKTAPSTTKKHRAASIDDVLEDIESKITLVKGSSPAETTRKMIETIASDGLLSDSEKKSLTEIVGRLAD